MAPAALVRVVLLAALLAALEQSGKVMTVAQVHQMTALNVTAVAVAVQVRLDRRGPIRKLEAVATVP